MSATLSVRSSAQRWRSPTRDVHVEDTVVAPLRSHLNTRMLVELAATVAAYKIVARCPEALHLAS